MTDQPSESQSAQTNSKNGFIQWLIVALILMTALSLLAVHLPERLKLLLVYAIVYGLISGGVLTTLAVKFGVPQQETDSDDRLPDHLRSISGPLSLSPAL